MLIINMAHMGQDAANNDMYFVDSFTTPDGKTVEREPNTLELVDFTQMVGYTGPCRIVTWMGGQPIDVTYGTIQNVTREQFQFIEGGYYGG